MKFLIRCCTFWILAKAVSSFEVIQHHNSLRSATHPASEVRPGDCDLACYELGCVAGCGGCDFCEEVAGPYSAPSGRMARSVQLGPGCSETCLTFQQPCGRLICRECPMCQTGCQASCPKSKDSCLQDACAACPMCADSGAFASTTAPALPAVPTAPPAATPKQSSVSWQFVALPNGDLAAVKKGPTRSGKTEAYVLSHTSNFGMLSLEMPTGLSATDSAWSFVVAPTGDLIGLQRRLGPPPQPLRHLRTELLRAGSLFVSVLGVRSHYAAVAEQMSTPLRTHGELWAFAMGGNGDLVCIRASKPEDLTGASVHVLSRESKYQVYAMHENIPVAFTNLQKIAFAVTSEGDLMCIRRGPSTESGRTEVQILERAEGFQKTKVTMPTALEYSHTSDWDFVLLPNGDLACVLKGSGEGSFGQAEVRVLSKRSNYTEFASRVVTPLDLSS